MKKCWHPNCSFNTDDGCRFHGTTKCNDWFEPETYDKLPKWKTESSDGEKAKNHGCGGRCWISYDENRKYHVECEKCGWLYIQHWGIGIGYACEKPNLDGWQEVE